MNSHKATAREESAKEAQRLRGAEASGSSSGSGGGDPNEKMMAKLIVDTLQAQNFIRIPPEGVASLIGVLSKAVTQGMVCWAGKATR
jgi:hypothetical protein